MAEIDKHELARIVGADEDGEHLKKESRIIRDKKQYSLRIPARFAEIMQLDPEKDTFEFTLEPEDEEGKKFTLKGKLKRE